MRKYGSFEDHATGGEELGDKVREEDGGVDTDRGELGG